MGDMSGLVVKVVSQEGTCTCGHEVGDEFVLGDTTPPGLCSWAFSAIFPFANVLQFGGAFPWEKDPGRALIACPDPDNPVVFEVRRTEVRPGASRRISVDERLSRPAVQSHEV